MKIAILSDSHDNIWKLEEALTKMNCAEAIIHCGDLCSPFVMKQIGETAGQRPVHIVWGNNDGDPRMLTEIASGYPVIKLHGTMADLEIAGLRIAVNHYPQIGRGLAASGQYDLVCYGHDHKAAEVEYHSCLLLNPGEIMGMNGDSTFALFDTITRQAEFVVV
jgi:putative phosphoesterase